MIDARQIFVLYLDAAPREASLIENVFFSVDGVNERIGINIITGKDRNDILKAINHNNSDGIVVLIQAKQAFPDNAAVTLVWGQGVASESGIATEKDQLLSFKTRSPFRADFSCTREKADRDCIPILPMGLRFTAPIAVKEAEEIVITGPPGTKTRKWQGKINDHDRKSGIVSYLTFPGPFPEKSKLTLHLPGRIKDDSDRALSNADKFPLTVKTDAYPPLAKFAARFGIIEAKGDRLLPVTIRNIERQMEGRILKVEEGAGAGPEAVNEQEPGSEQENAPAAASTKKRSKGTPVFT